MKTLFKLQSGASPAGGGGGGGGGARGQCPPDFRFCSPRYFFGRKKLVFLGGKNVKICDFGQKKPTDVGEDLFFVFFFVLEITCFWSENLRFRPEKAFGFRRFVWKSPAFGRKICDFGHKKPSHFGENLCPPDFCPPISRSWRRPWLQYDSLVHRFSMCFVRKPRAPLEKPRGSASNLFFVFLF